MVSMSPALFNANHNERDDGANDEQADDRHASVDLPPPDRTRKDGILFAVHLNSV